MFHWKTKVRSLSQLAVRVYNKSDMMWTCYCVLFDWLQWRALGPNSTKCNWQKETTSWLLLQDWRVFIRQRGSERCYRHYCITEKWIWPMLWTKSQDTVALTVLHLLLFSVCLSGVPQLYWSAILYNTKSATRLPWYLWLMQQQSKKSKKSLQMSENSAELRIVSWIN